MIEMIFIAAAMAGSMWLAVALVDAIVAIRRREWRLSIRNMLMFTAVISLVLGAFCYIFRR
jgi:hypothetical protein